MAKQATRATARKVKDKWRAKNWYNLLAPEMFDRQSLGETPAEEPGNVVGRVADVTVQDLTGDFSKMHIKLHFKVHDVSGSDAHTQFVGHDMTSDYVRRLTRRKRTRTDTVIDAATKDGWTLRLKPMAISERRIQGSKQRAIRDIMNKVVADAAARATVGELVKAVISGDLAKQVAAACRPVHPVSRVEIRKSEVVSTPTVPEEPPATEGLPAEPEAPAESPAEAAEEPPGAPEPPAK